MYFEIELKYMIIRKVTPKSSKEAFAVIIVIINTFY